MPGGRALRNDTFPVPLLTKALNIVKYPEGSGKIDSQIPESREILCANAYGCPVRMIKAEIELFSFHFIFNSLNRVKASITKITALQLALSTKQRDY